MYDAVDALETNDVGALVVGLRKVEGIVTERDIVRALAARRDPATTTVGEIATANPVWCDAHASIADATEEMMEHWVRHLLLERSGKLVGIVSARDLLGACAEGEP